ncbi:MAG: cytochrome c biogenesis protein CcdA [Candidatus Hydrogenedentes bacterium]|nr:cytochrome c biogenesis protein CcdA [Candidatus Hydrogenedentota bacterium]
MKTGFRIVGLAAMVLVVLAMPVEWAAAQAKNVRVETNLIFDTDAAHAGSTIYAALEVDIEKGYHIQSNAPLEQFLIPAILTFTLPEGVEVLEIVYPEAILLDTEISAEPLAVFEGRFVVGVALEIRADIGVGEHAIQAKLHYQACDDKACFQPQDRFDKATLKIVPPDMKLAMVNPELFKDIIFTGAREEPVTVEAPGPAPEAGPVDEGDVMAQLEEFTVLGTTGGYLKSKAFLTFIDEAETGTIRKNPLEGRGPLVILLLVTLGGLALNLTPCVLPLVPINMAIIGAGAQAGSRSRGFALGGTYGLAMAAVYGALGLIVILTAGTFGAINSSIWFNVGIAVLFIVLGLAMFDIIAIDFSKFQSKFSLAGKAKKGTFLLAFGMGGISALLAGACVAPVVIQVVVYASDQYTKGQAMALALPFFLGIGMALPWPFAGAGLSFLPKPGPWMVRVKQVMGVFILVFAAYYAHLGWKIFDSTRVDRDLVASAQKARLDEGWTASLSEGLATAKAENKLVFVDMWATWCKNCLTMDKTTFRNDDVLARLEDYVKVKFQAEDLEASPAHEVLDRFDGIGLPTYAILRPKQSGESSNQ